MSYATFEDGIGYEGKVTLTLKSDNHVIKSNTFKNNGTNQLFTFLGYCLMDDYEEARKLLPTKILLLYNGSSNPPTHAKARNELKIMSQPASYAQVPSIVTDAEGVKVTYSFEVPKNLIEGNFNQIGLYGYRIDRAEDFSAYYFLTDSNGGFAEENVSSWSATAVLLVEWELSISNKNVISSNSREEGAQ